MANTNKEILIRKQKFSILSLKEIDKKEYLHKLLCFCECLLKILSVMGAVKTKLLKML